MANVPINNITDTWNSSGTTFTGIKFNVASDTSASGSLLMDLQVGGTSQFKVDKAGYITASGLGLNSSNRAAYTVGTGLVVNQQGYFAASIGYQKVMFWTSASVGWTSDGANLDLALARDAANTLAQRNGANAQEFRLYNTWANNGVDTEYAKFKWNSNVLEIGTAIAGAGTARSLALQTNGTTRLTIGATAAEFTFGSIFDLRARAGTSRAYLTAPNGFSFGTSGVAQEFLDLSFGTTINLMVGREALNASSKSDFRITATQPSNNNFYACDLRFVAGNAASGSTTTNALIGGHIYLTGGNGSSASASTAHGGDIILQGGTGYGTGRNGLVIINNLPTSNPAVAGALWNDAGTLKVSAG